MRKIEQLSVVIPCHNEEEVLDVTHERLTKLMENLLSEKRITRYELIYVDNGSTDKTLSVLKRIYKKDKYVRLISLRRNFAYQGSISAGLFHSAGNAVVTIDADLQDPPEKIPEMISLYERDYDLVLGIRSDRSTDSFLKRFFSVNYYRLLKMLGADIVHNHGDFRLMDRSLVKEFNRLSERNRLIRALILQLDSNYATVTYRREERVLGESKFKSKDLFSLGLDGIISFSIFPLRLSSIMGVFSCILSFIGVVWVIFIKITTDVIPGWASTLLPIFVFGGLQLLFLGLIGEYIGRLYVEVKQRPLFLVRKEYRHDSE